ncbi:Hypothetical_protein [Hexamita inflata]|uniref:Hypothetical_protein n=1 Tax=Hexamita inflata TaxID=28002 RepID=A0AA86N6A8_9EUKA|nr:Hypothetical protein HINF_LOCUS1211 [Hexamita inflata]
MYSKLDTLLTELQNALNISQQYNQIDNIIYQTMMLSDSHYKYLFYQISFNMNINIDTLRQMFQSLLFDYFQTKQSTFNTICFSKSDCANNINFPFQTQDNNTSNPDLIPKQQSANLYLNNIINVNNVNNTSKLLKQKYLKTSQFKSHFTSALKSTLSDLIQQVNQMNDQQLCAELLNHFKVQNQNKFWVKLHQIINDKTPTQLKEYFQKSFLKCMFEQLSKEDETVLRNLERKMKDKKPAEIAEIFMGMTQQKYFKRSIIMFIVNSRL